ncbi:hypothetical protein ASG89_16110 [Paenibacillus sp. Soil766]|uniref:TauD/TfdA family dioxygenase n=1 Tax=Paenibacillus sp. Soil766 TaxID=1736404 RepID=UPI00070CB8AF|nr:TauD/TfdA family dioxygenase [Paenibacillus sp. Soil766]KRF09736.1 hypothetical protein ASG89_16110 [Paenibacillus sp. Soil766]
MDINLNKLRDNGWIFEREKLINQDNLLQLAFDLGEPIPSRLNSTLIDTLVPMDANKAKPKSLSAVYGVGQFPLHTDTAYIKIPARYIILYAKQIEGEVQPTTLLDLSKIGFSQDLEERLDRCLYTIANSRHSFLATLRGYSNIHRKKWIRFDSSCMRPTNKESSVTMNELNDSISKIKLEIINWSQGDILIIDNWRCLHGRGVANSSAKAVRVIERVTIL